MKKIIATIITALTLGIGASAQSYDDDMQQALNDANTELAQMQQKQKYKEIWRTGRYTDLGYAIAQTGTDFEPVEKGKFGFFIRKGTSFLFPGKPLGGIVKIGFDINWFETSVAKYKSGSMGKSDNWDNIGNSGQDDYDDGYDYDDEDSGFDFMEKFSNLGRWSIMVGAFGIGPNVTAAPFSMFNNAARFIKASLYFHYQPTFGAYLVSEDGNLEASYSYCHMFEFGGKITWKAIGLGIEGHWGHGKFKQLGFNFDNETDYTGVFDRMETASDKVTRRWADTRIYLTFSF
ncbi:MAG: hypothetical protein K2H14_01605 [Muribaculaceae bacterium]|nr:hypothetical protein [Muribaculaceae bacterium]